MGGTTNATDNFDVKTVDVQETRAEVDAALDSPASPAVVLDNAAVIAERPTIDGHVHGPNCGHDHSHDEEQKEPPKGKYLTPAMIPSLDLVKSFNANNEGPIWRKTPHELLTNISFQAAHVPEGGVKLCFVNNEAYKFLLALPGFRKQFQPASAEQQKLGVVGLFATQIVIVCDALWEAGEQLTLHKAIYFTDEVLAPVTEVVIETAEVEQAAAEHANCTEECTHAHHGHHAHAEATAEAKVS